MKVDYAAKQLNKEGQFLCGDNIEVIKNDDNTIIVLSDGLGSGVKANISSTFTKIIIAKLLSNGVELEKVLETLRKTLPTCQLRNIAYSTFSVIQIFDNFDVNLIEFDSPNVFHMRNGKLVKNETKAVTIHEQEINITKFKAKLGDYFVIASDGVIQAGRGGLLNAGWGWHRMKDFIQEQLLEVAEPELLAKKLILYADLLDQEKIKDDMSVIVVNVREERVINIAIGPPSKKELDKVMLKQFLNAEGKKLICGGTTANIVAKELKTKPKSITTKSFNDIPSKIEIEGIDLATEGLLTLSQTLDSLDSVKQYKDVRKNKCNLHNILGLYSRNDIFEQLKFKISDYEKFIPNNPAEELALAMEIADVINFYIGTAKNTANLSNSSSLKSRNKLSIVERIIEKLTEKKKKIFVTYF